MSGGATLHRPSLILQDEGARAGVTGLPAALAPHCDLEVGKGWCSRHKPVRGEQGVGRGAVRAPGQDSCSGSPSIGSCPARPLLSHTHTPPPTAHSLIVGSHLSGGLTKRLFSKTLSLESESKSLQEARGWGEGGALSSGQGHGDRVTSGDDLIPTSLGLSRVRGGIRGLSRRKLR